MCSDSFSRSAPPTGDPFALQGADDLVEQGAAPAHQDQHVAVAARPHPARRAIEHAVAARRPCDLIARAIRRGQLLVGALGRFGVHRRPGIELLARLARLQRPEVDAAGRFARGRVGQRTAGDRLADRRAQPGAAPRGRRRRRRRRPAPPAPSASSPAAAPARSAPPAPVDQLADRPASRPRSRSGAAPWNE